MSGKKDERISKVKTPSEIVLPEDIKKDIKQLGEKLDKNAREANQTTLAVIGFSVAMAGIVLWIQAGKVQIETWASPSNLLVFYGTLIAVLAALMYKESFKKWIRIAFKVLLAVFIALVVAIVIIILLH